MSNVVKLETETTLDLSVDDMLEANKGTFDTLLFCGRDKNGKFISGCSIGDVGETLVLLELFKRDLMDGVE